MSALEQTVAINVLTGERPRRGVGAEIKVFLTLLAVHSLLDCFAGVFPMFKHLSGMSLTIAGTMSTVATITSWATQPYFGAWADRGYMRTHILLGVVLTFPMMLLGFIGMHFAAMGAWAYVFIFLCLMSGRMGQAVFHPAGGAVAGNIVPSKRSMLVATWVAFGWLGYGCSNALFAWTYTATGGHTELLLIPGAMLLAAGFAWCRPEEHADRRSLHGRVPMMESLRTIFTPGRGLIPLFFSLAFISALGQGLFFVLPEFVAAKGYPQWLVNGGALGMIVIGSAAAMVPAGYVADRVGRKAVMVGSLILSLGSFLLMVHMPLVSPWIFCAVLIMTGGLMNIANPVGVAIGQYLLPGQRSFATGVLMGLSWALGGIAPIISGALTQHYGAVTALTAVSLVNLIAIPLAIMVPAERNR